MLFEKFWEITGLAAVDAVNPCTLAVQTMMLAALTVTKGKRGALLGGIFFTATVYVMYFLYGLGILTALNLLGIGGIIHLILKALLVIMIVMEFSAVVSYKPGFRSLEMPMKLRPITKKVLHSVENPLMAIPVAVLCSVLLLPCSSGPYFTGTMLIHQFENPVEGYLALAYYNLIFVLPMIAITLLVSYGMSPEKVMKWREKNIRKLHLIAGLLLLAVLIMVW